MLKIGVFGVGRLGKFHLKNWREISGAKLVGFYDPNGETAREVENYYQLRSFPDPDSLIDASDVIDVVAPTSCHYELCEKAIRKGRHVFVEKPLANTMDEGRKLVKLANESGIKFQVGHLERFNPAFLAIKDLDLNPSYIEVERLDEFNSISMEGSVILDLMIHDIDIILSIVKSDVKNIAATGVNVMTDTPDIANVRIEFHNGCVANLTSSRVALKKKQSMRLFQKDTCYDIDFLNKATGILKLKEPKDVSAYSINLARTDPDIPEVDAIRKELEEFTEAITNNTKTIVSEMDGLLAMDVAHQVLEKIGNHVIARA